MDEWKSLCPGCFTDKGTAKICKHCGYNESLRRSSLLLPHRTLLNDKYLVGRILGKPGGFGITYLAWDITLETYVAVKEYLPRDVAGRDTDRATVVAYSGEEEELFKYGLESFLQEARTLAKFKHPNVVGVHNFFEQNGTAYLVMDFYRGKTLEEYVKEKGKKLPVQTAINIMMAVLDGLREVHSKGFLHRDIKPHNIYLTEEGRIILLDFGTARLAMGERSRSLSAVLTPGFAPYEQYHRRGKQGPWTDIYACGATLYYLITGEVPPEATERMERDELIPPERFVPEISPNLKAALLQALATNQNIRPQNALAFQNMLSADISKEPTPAPAPRMPPKKSVKAPTPAPKPSRRFEPIPQEGLQSSDKTWIFLGNLCISPLLGVILYFVWKDNKPVKSKEVCKLTWWAVGIWAFLIFLFILITIMANA